MRKHHLDLDLQYALLSLLDTARIQQSPPFTRDYVKILQQQRKLGNDSVFFGFFTTDWINMQKDYLQLMKLPSTRNEANTCMTQITIYIYNYIHSLWLLRNSHVHDTDLNQVNSYRRIQLLHEIEQMYEQQPLMLHSDRDLFALPMSHRQTYHSVKQLRYFIQETKPIIKQSIEDAKRLGNKHRKITWYFTPKEKPPPEPDPRNPQ